MTKPTVHDRYAHQTGRLFEDFVVGDIYHHLPGRTISQNDNAWFTLLTMNTHPLHFDEEYAAATEFGRPLVASPLTVAIVVGMSVSDVSATAIANLGWKEIKLPAPFSQVTRFTPTQKYWANANLNRGPMPASSAF